jgi:hypothetical protein
MSSLNWNSTLNCGLDGTGSLQYVSPSKASSIEAKFDAECQCCNEIKKELLDISQGPGYPIICFDCLKILHANAFAPSERIIESLKKEKKDYKKKIADLKKRKQAVKVLIAKQKKEKKSNEKKEKEEGKQLPKEILFQVKKEVSTYNQCCFVNLEKKQKIWMNSTHLCSNCNSLDQITLGVHPGLCLKCLELLFEDMKKKRTQYFQERMKAHESKKKVLEDLISIHTVEIEMFQEKLKKETATATATATEEAAEEATEEAAE